MVCLPSPSPLSLLVGPLAAREEGGREGGSRLPARMVAGGGEGRRAEGPPFFPLLLLQRQTPLPSFVSTEKKGEEGGENLAEAEERKKEEGKDEGGGEGYVGKKGTGVFSNGTEGRFLKEWNVFHRQ